MCDGPRMRMRRTELTHALTRRELSAEGVGRQRAAAWAGGWVVRVRSYRRRRRLWLRRALHGLRLSHPHRSNRGEVWR